MFAKLSRPRRAGESSGSSSSSASGASSGGRPASFAESSSFCAVSSSVAASSASLGLRVRRLRLGGFRRGRLRLWRRFSRHGSARRGVGIVETLGFRTRRDQRHVPRRLPGVMKTGRELEPGIGRQRGEHAVHAIDLHPLVSRDIGGEREQLGILRRPALPEQTLDHGQGAAVVLDHQLEEQPVELDRLCGGQPIHLFSGQHARHRRPVGRMVRVDRRDRLCAHAQPLLHHRDLVFLRDLDASRKLPHHIAPGACGEQPGHLERLGVMGNHALHELHVRVRVADAGEIGGFGRGDLPTRFARRAGLHDRGLRLTWRYAEREARQTGHDGRGGQRMERILSVHVVISADLTGVRRSICIVPPDGGGDGRSLLRPGLGATRGLARGSQGGQGAGIERTGAGTVRCRSAKEPQAYGRAEDTEERR